MQNFKTQKLIVFLLSLFFCSYAQLASACPIGTFPTSYEPTDPGLFARNTVIPNVGPGESTPSGTLFHTQIGAATNSRGAHCFQANITGTNPIPIEARFSSTLSIGGGGLGTLIFDQVDALGNLSGCTVGPIGNSVNASASPQNLTIMSPPEPQSIQLFDENGTYIINLQGSVPPGIYQVCLGILNEVKGGDPPSQTFNVEFHNNQTPGATPAPTTPQDPPNPDFLATADGLNVSFDPVSNAASCPACAHNWFFGDGNSTTTVAPTHGYSQAGTYTIKHNVTENNLLATAVQTKTVAEKTTDPIANPPTEETDCDDIPPECFTRVLNNPLLKAQCPPVIPKDCKDPNETPDGDGNNGDDGNTGDGEDPKGDDEDPVDEEERPQEDIPEISTVCPIGECPESSDDALTQAFIEEILDLELLKKFEIKIKLARNRFVKSKRTKADRIRLKEELRDIYSELVILNKHFLVRSTDLIFCALRNPSKFSSDNAKNAFRQELADNLFEAREIDNFVKSLFDTFNVDLKELKNSTALDIANRSLRRIDFMKAKLDGEFGNSAIEKKESAMILAGIKPDDVRANFAESAAKDFGANISLVIQKEKKYQNLFQEWLRILQGNRDPQATKSQIVDRLNGGDFFSNLFFALRPMTSGLYDCYREACIIGLNNTADKLKSALSSDNALINKLKELSDKNANNKTTSFEKLLQEINLDFNNADTFKGLAADLSANEEPEEQRDPGPDPIQNEEDLQKTIESCDPVIKFKCEDALDGLVKAIKDESLDIAFYQSLIKKYDQHIKNFTEIKNKGLLPGNNFFFASREEVNSDVRNFLAHKPNIVQSYSLSRTFLVCAQESFNSEVDDLAKEAFRIDLMAEDALTEFCENNEELLDAVASRGDLVRSPPEQQISNILDLMARLKAMAEAQIKKLEEALEKKNEALIKEAKETSRPVPDIEKMLCEFSGAECAASLEISITQEECLEKIFDQFGKFADAGSREDQFVNSLAVSEFLDKNKSRMRKLFLVATQPLYEVRRKLDNILSKLLAKEKPSKEEQDAITRIRAALDNIEGVMAGELVALREATIDIPSFMVQEQLRQRVLAGLANVGGGLEFIENEFNDGVTTKELSIQDLEDIKLSGLGEDGSSSDPEETPPSDDEVDAASDDNEVQTPSPELVLKPPEEQCPLPECESSENSLEDAYIQELKDLALAEKLRDRLVRARNKFILSGQTKSDKETYIQEVKEVLETISIISPYFLSQARRSMICGFEGILTTEFSDDSIRDRYFSLLSDVNETDKFITNVLVPLFDTQLKKLNKAPNKNIDSVAEASINVLNIISLNLQGTFGNSAIEKKELALRLVGKDPDSIKADLAILAPKFPDEFDLAISKEALFNQLFIAWLDAFDGDHKGKDIKQAINTALNSSPLSLAEILSVATDPLYRCYRDTCILGKQETAKKLLGALDRDKLITGLLEELKKAKPNKKKLKFYKNRLESISANFGTAILDKALAKDGVTDDPVVIERVPTDLFVRESDLDKTIGECPRSLEVTCSSTKDGLAQSLKKEFLDLETIKSLVKKYKSQQQTIKERIERGITEDEVRIARNFFVPFVTEFNALRNHLSTSFENSRTLLSCADFETSESLVEDGIKAASALDSANIKQFEILVNEISDDFSVADTIPRMKAFSQERQLEIIQDSYVRLIRNFELMIKNLEEAIRLKSNSLEFEVGTTEANEIINGITQEFKGKECSELVRLSIKKEACVRRMVDKWIDFIEQSKDPQTQFSNMSTLIDFIDKNKLTISKIFKTSGQELFRTYTKIQEAQANKNPDGVDSSRLFTANTKLIELLNSERFALEELCKFTNPNVIEAIKQRDQNTFNRINNFLELIKDNFFGPKAFNKKDDIRDDIKRVNLSTPEETPDNGSDDGNTEQPSDDQVDAVNDDIDTEAEEDESTAAFDKIKTRFQECAEERSGRSICAKIDALSSNRSTQTLIGLSDALKVENEFRDVVIELRARIQGLINRLASSKGDPNEVKIVEQLTDIEFNTMSDLQLQMIQQLITSKQLLACAIGRVENGLDGEQRGTFISELLDASSNDDTIISNIRNNDLSVIANQINSKVIGLEDGLIKAKNLLDGLEILIGLSISSKIKALGLIQPDLKPQVASSLERDEVKLIVASIAKESMIEKLFKDWSQAVKSSLSNIAEEQSPQVVNGLSERDANSTLIEDFLEPARGPLFDLYIQNLSTKAGLSVIEIRTRIETQRKLEKILDCDLDIQIILEEIRDDKLSQKELAEKLDEAQKKMMQCLFMKGELRLEIDPSPPGGD